MGMKTLIVTRAFNRLEYTIRCINAVRNCTQGEDYTHLIVDQASTDGTKEWLEWIQGMPSKWYPRIRVLNLERNRGDFGGMIRGVEYADYHFERYDYIVQLDNDIEVPNTWLSSMRMVLESEDAILAPAVMLKIGGVQSVMGTLGERRVRVGQWVFSVCLVPKVVACYIIRLHDFLQAYPHCETCDGLIKALNRVALRIDAKECIPFRAWQMEGYIRMGDEDMEYPEALRYSYVQHDKYDVPGEKCSGILK